MSSATVVSSDTSGSHQHDGRDFCDSIDVTRLQLSQESDDDLMNHTNFSSHRSDSGISTIDSAYSKTSSALSSFLLAEHNNNNDENAQNNNNAIDVVRFLKLKSTDDETQQMSNSSSLESLTSLDHEVGVGSNNVESDDDDDDLGSGSTSCSEDSFEMSSTCSARESDLTPETSPLREARNGCSFFTTSESTAPNVNWSTSLAPEQKSSNIEDLDEEDDDDELLGDCLRRIHPELLMSPSSTYSGLQSISTSCTSASKASVRESISRELSNLDTGLPELDFDKLEEQLKKAAREREDQERRLLGEEVRRRLALQVDSASGPCPVVNTRPNRSNLAMRLQTAMNLQVCYMNELAESTAEEDTSDTDADDYDDDEEDDDDETFLSTTKSSPSLKKSCRPGSSKEAPELERLRQKALEDRILDGYERHKLLVSETRRVLDSAKSEAVQALEHYRRTKSKASSVPRQSRQHLSKMSWIQIQKIHDAMAAAIAQKNVELVNLLIDRDSLHMEHDSLLVDIEDFTEHEAQASALDFRQLLRMQMGELPPAPRSMSATGPTFPGSKPGQGQVRAPPSAKVSAPTPLTTPTSPSRSFVASLSLLSTSLPALPKSLSKFNLFGVNTSASTTNGFSGR